MAWVGGQLLLSLPVLRERLDPAQSLAALLFRMARPRALRPLRDARLHARGSTFRRGRELLYVK